MHDSSNEKRKMLRTLDSGPDPTPRERMHRRTETKEDQSPSERTSSSRRLEPMHQQDKHVTQSLNVANEEEGSTFYINKEIADVHKDTARDAHCSIRERKAVATIGTAEKPRQWLQDRVQGKSRDPIHTTEQGDGDSKPPCPLCYVPPPVLWWSPVLEENQFCQGCGRSGWSVNRTVRRTILWIALLSNIVGLNLMFLSALSITQDNFDLLWHFSFTRVYMHVKRGPDEYNAPADYRIGLRAIAWQSYQRNKEGIVPFGNLCDNTTFAPNDPVGAFLRAHESFRSFDCDECQQTSKRIVPSLFLSMLSYIPNFTTDVLRMWEHYDVNCQKTLATTFSWVSLSTAIYTWINYRNKCFASLQTDPLAFDLNYTTVNVTDPAAFIVVEFDWEAGFAQVCLALASLLKVIDILGNVVIQTPSITRNTAEQTEYERNYGAPAEVAVECIQIVR